MRRIVMTLLFTSQVIFAQWIQLGVSNGLPSNSEEILSIGVIGNRLIIGTAYNGLYVSDDNGDTWRKPTGTEPDDTNLMITAANRIIAGSAAPGYGVFVSDDNGENWTTISNGLEQNGTIFSTRILGVANGKVYLASNGLFVSTDNGDTWQKVSSGLPVAGDPQGLTVIGSNFFCTWGSRVYTSSDGLNWQLAGNNGLPPGNPQLREIIANNSTLLVHAQNTGLYRSTDNGTNWSRISGMNGYDTSARELFTHNNIVYAATSLFVYQSSDEGLSWAEVDANFPKPTNMTVLNASSSTLLAGQYAGGAGQLWKYSFSATGIEFQDRLPQEFSLSQNYPNPFNPATTISYTLSRAGHVKLKVYDVLGKEIRTLVDSPQRPGEYQVHFGGGNLPTGVYFYRLQFNGKNTLKRMILAK
jgi:photosystem II stability/assembly factor-like uncharacterized protein